MLRYLFLLITLVCFFGCPMFAAAQGNTLFPEERIRDLKITYADPDNASVVFKNKANEQQKGYVGDFVGAERAEVVQVTYRHLRVKQIEINIDEKGNIHEQPWVTDLPFYYPGVNCARDALPWLNGTWELTHDPDNGKIDWLFFNNKTCQFGLMLHDGRVTGAPSFDVDARQDGSFRIDFSIGNSRTIYLNVSPDRSRIYNETGAYYTKVSDDYREMNDRTFRTRRLKARGE